MNHPLRRPFVSIVALILFAVASACSSSSGTERNDEIARVTAPETDAAQEAFLRGNQALDAGDVKGAISEYDQALSYDDSRWDIHMNRGIALVGLSEFRDATDAFARALESGGAEEPVVYFNLGNLYQERGLYERAIDAYRTSMAMAGGLDYDTLLNIAACFTFVHAYENAQETIERAIEMRPDDPRGYLSLGLIQFSLDEPDEALAIYDSLLASFPDFAAAHYNRGVVLLRTQQREPALQAFQAYLQLDPEGPYTRQAQSHINNIERRLQGTSPAP